MQDCKRTISHSASDAFNFLQKALHEVVVNIGMNQNPSARHAGLSRCYEGGKSHSVNGIFDICILEDDYWGLSTELSCVSC